MTAELVRLVRAEARKLVTIWSTYVLVGASAVASALLGLLVAYAPHRRAVAEGLWPAQGSASWFDDVNSAMLIAQDLALVLGILIVTTEYRHKTVTATYLGEPRRGRVTAAKLVASLASGAVIALAAGLGGLALDAALVGSGSGSFHVMLAEFGRFFPGMLAGGVLFAIYGLGLGAILRNQVVALVVGLGVSAVVEPIIVAVWPSVGEWLPDEAARSLESVSTTTGALGGASAHLLPSWEGAIVLLAYGVVLAGVGSFTTLQADVT